jgi:beta-lactamase class A
MEALASTLEAEIAPYGGDWAVYVRNLNNGTVINLGDQSLPSASVIKIFIAGAYLEAVEEGRLEDTCADSLRCMITESDNSATNRIIDYVGMDNINRFIEKYGFTETKLQRHMLESSSRDNFSSARDAGICLAMIYDGNYVSAEASETMRNLLLQQERRGKIPAGLPSGTKCGNKTGELNYAENDAAIIWGPACDYVLVVFAGNISAPGTAQSQIRHLSTTVYEGMNNMGSGRQDAYAADTAATAAETAETAADAASTGETASD